MMTSSKTMMTGMMTRTVSTLRNKNQFSMKQRKKPLLFEQPRRRRLHLSDEPNGSDTRGCLAQDGVLLMEWITNNVAISSIEDHLFVLDTARLRQLVDFTQVDSRKSWSTISTIWKPLILRHRPLVLDERLVVASVRTSTHVLMN